MLFAALVALGLHGLLLSFLTGPSRLGESTTPSHRLTIRLLKPAATQAVQPPADQTVTSRLSPRRVAPPTQESVPVQSSSQSAEVAAPAPSASLSEQPGTQSAPLAPPLRLDSAVLQAAAAQSKGAVRRMAEASGSELPSSQVAVVAQLEGAVAQSGKPSCLAANPTGSLLSLPLIALAAMTSQCN